jgi:hypothetical protein
MFSLDDRPALPEAPAFRTDMEQFLASAARREPRRSRQMRRGLIAGVAGGAALAIAIGAAAGQDHRRLGLLQPRPEPEQVA